MYVRSGDGTYQFLECDGECGPVGMWSAAVDNSAHVKVNDESFGWSLVITKA